MLPEDVTLELFEAMQDQQITTAETTGMMTTVFSSAITAMVMAFGIMMFNRVLSSNPGNPGTAYEIIDRAGMREYEYKWFPEPEEERPKRVYPYTRRKVIDSYELVMTRTNDTCMIKLYEYMPGWKKKLRATWSGMGKATCDAKFEQVCEVIRQVRFEHAAALRRK